MTDTVSGRDPAGQALVATPSNPHAVSTEGFDPSRWTDYASERPLTEGVYEWRVPSRHAEGVITQFFAHMRKRGAGYTDTISPVFDYWDGWKVHVPAGTQWRAVEGPPTIKSHEVAGVTVVGVENEVCPFCRNVPHWNGANRTGQGVLIGAKPHEYNRWWLECCGWSKTPHLEDPRELSKFRNAAIATEARRAVTTGAVHEGAGPQDIAQNKDRDHD